MAYTVLWHLYNVLSLQKNWQQLHNMASSRGYSLTLNRAHLAILLGGSSLYCKKKNNWIWDYIANLSDGIFGLLVNGLFLFEWSIKALKEMAFNCFYIYNVGEVCTSYFCWISVLSKGKYLYTLLIMVDAFCFSLWSETVNQ